MSSDARLWAHHQYVKPASAKLLLIVLCDHEQHATKRIFPSIERLAVFTSLDRKTIIAAKARLMELGLLVETEQRVGSSGRIKVYRVNRQWGGPWIDRKGRLHEDGSNGPVSPKDSTENGTRDSTENGTIRESRNRYTEPSREEPSNRNQAEEVEAQAPKTAIGDLFGEVPVVIELDLPDMVSAAWNEMADRHPGIASIDVLNDSRRRKISARGNDAKKPDRSPWQAWQQVFEAIERSTYLCGEDPPGKGYTEPFRLKLDFVLRPDQFLSILEGGYRANRSALTHNLDTGRRYGPAEQVGRAALARVRAAAAERGNAADGGGHPQADGPGGDHQRPLRSVFDQYRDDAGGQRFG